MPSGGSYGRLLRGPSSFGHLDRIGPSESALAQYLYPIAFRDVAFVMDDFLQGPIANIGDHWTLGTDAGATAFAKSAGLGGRISGSSGASDNEAAAILSAADWFGDNQAGMEVRWQIDDVATTRWECGFSDPLSDDTLPAVSDVDTPAVANGATDVAMIHLDTDQTLTTAAFVTDGSTANMNTTASTLSPVYSMVAATYTAHRIQIVADAAQLLVFGTTDDLSHSVQHGTLTANSIEGGVALTARLFVGTRDTTPNVAIVDYIMIWGNRR